MSFEMNLVGVQGYPDPMECSYIETVMDGDNRLHVIVEGKATAMLQERIMRMHGDQALAAIKSINERNPYWWQEYGGAEFCSGCGIKLGLTRVSSNKIEPEPPHADDCPVVTLLDILGNDTHRRD